jgi:hypothetical protein
MASVSFQAWLSAGALALCIGASPLPALAQKPAEKTAEKTPQTPVQQAPELVQAFAKQSIHLDLVSGACAIPASVLVRDDLLEYLLVGPRGAVHESAFFTNVVPSHLNAALLSLGVVPGQNAAWVRRDPPPSSDELAQGAPAYDIRVPSGDGFFLYAAWKQAGESFWYRVEDLVLDRSTGAGMRRHKWVYLGSRMVRARPDQDEVFAADLEGNLINIAFFEAGNTLITGALEECVQQTIWAPNSWLLPPRDSAVLLVFSKERLSSLPASLAAAVPEVESPK